MTIEALEKQLKEQRYESVYVFYGPEEYLKARALKALREALLPEGLEQLNENTLEGCSAQEILSCADTPPVMCGRRLVVVRDWAPILSGKASSGEKELALLYDWMKDTSQSCTIVFLLTQEFDVKRKGLAPLMALPGAVSFDHREGAALYKLCNGILRPYGKKLDNAAFEELTTRVGNDLNVLSGELEKLSAYSVENKLIGIEDVRAAVTPSPEFVVFQILDCLFAGDLKTATNAVNRLMQDSSMNPVRLIITLASQLRTDLYIKSCEDKPDVLKDMLSLMKINSYRVKYISRSIRGISEERLRRGYLRCTEANYAVTSGRLNPRAALDDLMYRLSMKDG